MLADLPSHAVVGHLVVIVAPIAALLPRVLAPGRPRGRAAAVGAGVLVLGTLVTTATTLVQAMEAVWSHHPGWS
ncbi:hypothetical protein [Cellulomonas cellasea]|uniref:Uncharacterized protein n=2 Tax=Cellulomonas cellasea TaxID=43670 RepID=A0A0A0B3K9_9CELL|nr:hypothetical protein [Cellulomonas cellasea]KGM01405.1 hypothetical protein Q760_01630 [Cellulomonas cellasea DSM 20118]GEA87580.1 hypothetical protein CCE01nite_15290 [Cellulomonas cellasea]